MRDSSLWLSVVYGLRLSDLKKLYYLLYSLRYFLVMLAMP